MTSPTTGPFTRTQGTLDPGSIWYDKKDWYRQRRPYDLQLPYRNEHAVILERSEWGGLFRDCQTIIGWIDGSDYQQGRTTAWNKAYSRWLDKIGDNASIGVSLAESRQSMGMMTSRLAQLASFARAVRTLDAKAVSSSLGISVRRAHHVMAPYSIRSGLPVRVKRDSYGRPVRPVPSDRYERERDLANLWLEFWFGWSPLVKDIQSSCAVLDAPFKDTRVRGTGKAVATLIEDSGLPATVVTTLKLTYRAAFGGEVEIVNPNLRLAQQLGVLNPAVVGLELVPWSFVFGWFVNLQDYLSSFTDFAGLRIHKAYSSQKVFTLVDWRWRPCDLCSDAEKAIYLSSKAHGWGHVKTRTPLASVPRPIVRLSNMNLSPTRALTACSLLMQRMPRA